MIFKIKNILETNLNLVVSQKKKKKKTHHIAFNL